MILELLIWIAVFSAGLALLGLIADCMPYKVVETVNAWSDKAEIAILGQKEEPTGVRAPADSKIRF